MCTFVGLWLWAFARVIKFSRSNFANFRCNLASEKRFSVPAWYVRELPEKLIERKVMMKIFHTFLRHPSPVRKPPCVIMLSHYDRRIISTERWPKRKKARGVCTSNKPINKLIDGSIYFYDTPPPSTSPMCHLIISTIASDCSLFSESEECYLGMHS